MRVPWLSDVGRAACRAHRSRAGIGPRRRHILDRRRLSREPAGGAIVRSYNTDLRWIAPITRWSPTEVVPR
jgi:hypothetical protein